MYHEEEDNVTWRLSRRNDKRYYFFYGLHSKVEKSTRNAGRQVSAESTQRFLILKLLLLARKYECIVSW